MNKFAIILFTTVLSYGCVPEKGNSVDTDDISFTTTDASELFFKNVRKSYYEVDERKDQGIDLYRLKKRNKKAEYALIEMAIVHNWRNDNAFIMITPNTYIGPTDKMAVGKDTLSFQPKSMPEQIQMAAIIYNGIIENLEFTLIRPDSTAPFLQDSDDREAIKVTVYDYLKLTETF